VPVGTGLGEPHRGRCPRRSGVQKIALEGRLVVNGTSDSHGSLGFRLRLKSTVPAKDSMACWLRFPPAPRARSISLISRRCPGRRLVAGRDAGRHALDIPQAENQTLTLTKTPAGGSGRFCTASPPTTPRASGTLDQLSRANFLSRLTRFNEATGRALR